VSGFPYPNWSWRWSNGTGHGEGTLETGRSLDAVGSGVLMGFSYSAYAAGRQVGTT
jgi:hypothetical protein